MAPVEGLTEANTGKDVQCRSFRLHYHEAGSGPGIIMLHGGIPGSTAWGNYQRNFPFLAQHFRAVAMDMPGFGKSELVAVRESRQQVQARAIIELMDALGIERAHLLGSSSGGQSCLYAAMDWPHRVDKLVLMAPGGAGESVFYPEPTEGDTQLRRNFFSPNRESMRSLCETMCYDPSWLTDEFVDGRLAAWTHEHQEARRRSSRGDLDRESELRNVHHPTLLIWGREDRFNPYDTGLVMLARLPNARMHIFTHCGHWVQFEKADELNPLVLQFLSQ